MTATHITYKNYKKAKLSQSVLYTAISTDIESAKLLPRPKRK